MRNEGYRQSQKFCICDNHGMNFVKYTYAGAYMYVTLNFVCDAMINGLEGYTYCIMLYNFFPIPFLNMK